MTKCLVTRDYEGEFYQKPFVSTSCCRENPKIYPFLQIISWNRFTLLLKMKRQFGKQKPTFFPSDYCFYGSKELTQELNTRKISEIEIAFLALFQHVDFKDFYQKPVWTNEKFNFAEKKISLNQLFSNFIFTKFLPKCVVWKKEKFCLAEKIFREINYLVTSLFSKSVAFTKFFSKRCVREVMYIISTLCDVISQNFTLLFFFGLCMYVSFGQSKKSLCAKC